MDFLLLLALALRLLGLLLPWVMAIFLTMLFMDLAGIQGAYSVPTFLFGFFFIGLFLRDEVFRFIFRGKQ